MNLTRTQHTNIVAMQSMEQEFRGRYLANFSWVETILAQALSQYFCDNKDRRMLLFSDVFTGAGLQFRGKVTLFGSILRSLDGKIVDQYMPTFELMNNKIRKFRNRIAHCHLDSSTLSIDDFDGERIFIVFYESGVMKKQALDRKYMQEQTDDIELVKNSLLAFIKDVNIIS